MPARLDRGDTPGVIVELDKKQLAEIQKLFKVIPRHMRKALKSKWGKEGTKIKQHIQRSVMSGPTGARSVGKGPGIRTDRSFYGMKRKHLKQDVRRTVKVPKASAKTFGAFLRVGYSSSRGKRLATDAGYIGFFHEYGTENMPARKLIETAWDSYPQSRVLKAADDAIDEAIRKAGR